MGIFELIFAALTWVRHHARALSLYHFCAQSVAFLAHLSKTK